MSRPSGTTSPCDRVDARHRLGDAREFLEIAELAEAPKVKATNAITAAIAAADVITCLELGHRSTDGNHKAAATLLAQVDRDLGTTLKRALDLKTAAAYESSPMAAGRAAKCVEWARRILAEAERRAQS